MTEQERKAVQEKARMMRYKKPAVKMLNAYEMQDVLNDIMEECSYLQYSSDDEIEDVLGDEDAAYEFRMMFSDLSADAERMYNDLCEEMCWEHFDDCMVAACPNTSDLMGYDSYECDYFGLPYSYECQEAMKESAKRLERLTKDELIQTMQASFSVAVQFLGIKSRYDDLKATADIINGRHRGYIETINAINEAYEEANREEFYSWKPEVMKYDDLLKALVDPRIWIE